VVVGKLEVHRGGPLRGYIAMLAVKESYRGNGIGNGLARSHMNVTLLISAATKLVQMAIEAMGNQDADEVKCHISYAHSPNKTSDAVTTQVALETEITNTAAIKLYERLGFLRSKRLHRYYFNGNSAFRLILYLKPNPGSACCADDSHNHDHSHANQVDDDVS